MAPPPEAPGRPGRAIWVLSCLAVGYAALIAWLSSMPRPPVPEGLLQHDKLSHGLGYAVLGGLVAAALWAARTRPWRALALAAALASLYGVTDEVHQAFVPGRSSDPEDWVADTAGALAGAGAVVLALRRRRARASIRP